MSPNIARFKRASTWHVNSPPSEAFVLILTQVTDQSSILSAPLFVKVIVQFLVSVSRETLIFRGDR